MESQGLIGFTGYVGSHLADQLDFDHLYNSKNISSIGGQKLSRLYCAAAPGSMFEANKYPGRDAERIDSLIHSLKQVSCEQLILISTIAVLADESAGSNEDVESFEDQKAYGINRRRLEEFCQKNFENVLVVRLPALFGDGLKKNFIFDIINPIPSMLSQDAYNDIKKIVEPELTNYFIEAYNFDDALGMYVVDRAKCSTGKKRRDLEKLLIDNGLAAFRFTNPDSTFQYYQMSNLAEDIEKALSENLNLLHCAVEPVKADVIFKQIFDRPMAHNSARIYSEDFRTKHGRIWGSSSDYIKSKEEVTRNLTSFITSELSKK